MPLDRGILMRYGSILLIITLLILTTWRTTHSYSHPRPAHTSFISDPTKIPTFPLIDENQGNSSASIESPGSHLHIVIAHYDEEPLYIKRWVTSLRTIPSIQPLGIKVFLYTKNPESDISALEYLSGANEVILLPNIGREGSTYLHHILTYWDSLPPYTLFAQAVLKKAQIEGDGPDAGALRDWLHRRLEEKFSVERKVGFMSLDRKHDICHCGHCTDITNTDYYPLWPQLYAMMEGRPCSRQQSDLLSFNGHFIVSRDRIRRRSRELYEYLKHMVDAPQEHWVHQEPEPTWFDRRKGHSHPSNPKFGHTLERLWHVLFNCGDPEKVVDCEVGGSDEEEGPGGCTCLD